MFLSKSIFQRSLVSLSGGITGVIVYLIILHSNDGILSAERVNPAMLIAGILITEIIWLLLWKKAVSVMSEIFKREKEYDMITLIFSVPSILLIVLPFFFRHYEKIAAVNFSVIGYVYFPFIKYIHYNTAGYMLFTMLGFSIISVMFMLIMRFAFLFYEDCERLSGKSIIKYITGSLLIFYIVTTAYITMIYPPTGDEPHHLIITESLVSDFDLNLENDFITEKSYKKFYPVEMPYKDTHNNPGKNGFGLYSKHGAGLPVVIAPVYKLMGRYGVQIVMNIFAVLLMVLFYMFLTKFGIDRKISIATVYIMALTSPILINSSLVIIEVPAAVIVMFFLFMLYDPEIELITKSRSITLIMFAGIGFLPWLHTKFAVISLVLYLYYYISGIRYHFLNLKKEIYNNLLLGMFAFSFIIVNYAVYGSFATTAVTDAALSDTYYFIFSFMHSAKAFFAILFDRNYGALPHNIMLAVSAWGMMLVFRNKDWKRAVPFLIAVPYSSLFLFWNDWGGSTTPVRQYIPVILIFAGYIAYFFQNAGFIKTKLFKVMLFLSVAVSYIMMIVPAARYDSGKTKIFAVLEAKVPKLLWFFPDFHVNICLNHYITLLYFVVIILMYFIYYKGQGHEKKDKKTK